VGMGASLAALPHACMRNIMGCAHARREAESWVDGQHVACGGSGDRACAACMHACVRLHVAAATWRVLDGDGGTGSAGVVEGALVMAAAHVSPSSPSSSSLLLSMALRASPTPRRRPAPALSQRRCVPMLR
jgi:hypothetical protein